MFPLKLTFTNLIEMEAQTQKLNNSSFTLVKSERSIFDNFERWLRASGDMSKIISFPSFRNFLSGQRAGKRW